MEECHKWGYPCMGNSESHFLSSLKGNWSENLGTKTGPCIYEAQAATRVVKSNIGSYHFLSVHL